MRIRRKLVANINISNMNDKQIEFETNKIRKNCENSEAYDLVILHSDNNSNSSETLTKLYEAKSINDYSIWHLQIPTQNLNSIEAINKVQKRKSEIKMQLNLQSSEKLIVTEYNNSNGVYIYTI